MAFGNYANLQENNVGRYYTKYGTSEESMQEFRFAFNNNIEIDGKISYVPGLTMKNSFTAIDTNDKDITFELDGKIVVSGLLFKITDIQYNYKNRNLKYTNNTDYYITITLER